MAHWPDEIKVLPLSAKMFTTATIKDLLGQVQVLLAHIEPVWRNMEGRIFLLHNLTTVRVRCSFKAEDCIFLQTRISKL